MTALTLSMVATDPAPLTITPIGGLGPLHGLSPSDIRMLTRYFGLSSVASSKLRHADMCDGPLDALLSRFGELKARNGLLVHAKTQTHNTFAESGWLQELANRHGLAAWETLTVSMNHCASALSVCGMLAMTGENRPTIVLTGEKCFHPTTCRQSGAALGEAAAAMLLNHGPGEWRIADGLTFHLPQYNANPQRMEPQLRREFEASFGDRLMEFITRSLTRFFPSGTSPDLVVPYNLNLPLLQRMAAHFGWNDRLYTETIASIGHLFCTDVLYNLAQVLPRTGAARILCFAAGMGATFASLVLERVPVVSSRPILA